MTEYNLKQIKGAYEQKREWEKQFPLNYFIVRPVSFYISYIVLKITRNPAAVAFAGFLLGLAGCFLLLFSNTLTIWPGIIFILLYSVSDAVDGNVARTTGNVTLFGKYLDGLIGSLVDGSYIFFLGLGLYFAESGLKDPVIPGLINGHARALPLFLGSFALITKLWTDIFKSRYDSYKAQYEGVPGFDENRVKLPVGKSRYSNRWYFLIFINIDCLNNQLLLLIILSAMGLETWFLIFLACFFTIKSIVYFVFYFLKTKAEVSNGH